MNQFLEYSIVWLEALGLSNVRDHFHEILLSAIGWQVLYHVSEWIFSFFNFYKQTPAAKKSLWPMHVVSLAHSAAIVPLVVPMLLDTHLQDDKLLNYTHYSGSVLAFSAG